MIISYMRNYYKHAGQDVEYSACMWYNKSRYCKTAVKNVKREKLINYITEHYCAKEEHPWEKYAEYSVFRHDGNKKWFAVVMNVPKHRIGLDSGGDIDILNVKCGPLLAGSLQGERGFFPAYHMNKANWISAALDGSADDEKILWLLDISYGLTAEKAKNVRKRHKE